MTAVAVLGATPRVRDPTHVALIVSPDSSILGSGGSPYPTRSPVGLSAVTTTCKFGVVPPGEITVVATEMSSGNLPGAVYVSSTGTV